jgi:hypothetical protein
MRQRAMRVVALVSVVGAFVSLALAGGAGVRGW